MVKNDLTAQRIPGPIMKGLRALIYNVPAPANRGTNRRNPELFGAMGLIWSNPMAPAWYRGAIQTPHSPPLAFYVPGITETFHNDTWTGALSLNYEATFGANIFNRTNVTSSQRTWLWSNLSPGDTSFAYNRPQASRLFKSISLWQSRKLEQKDWTSFSYGIEDLNFCNTKTFLKLYKLLETETDFKISGLLKQYVGTKKNCYTSHYSAEGLEHFVFGEGRLSSKSVQEILEDALSDLFEATPEQNISNINLFSLTNLLRSAVGKVATLISRRNDNKQPETGSRTSSDVRSFTLHAGTSPPVTVEADRERSRLCRHDSHELEKIHDSQLCEPPGRSSRSRRLCHRCSSRRRAPGMQNSRQIARRDTVQRSKGSARASYCQSARQQARALSHTRASRPVDQFSLERAFR